MRPLRILLLLLAAASACMLGVALIAEYGFGLHPCELCMYQRYPYAAIIVLGFSSAALLRTPRVLSLMAILCCLLFATDAGIATYHAGVEIGWFPGPTACTNGDKPGETLEEMRAAIMNAQLVPCDQPMLHVLGISIAGWNALAAAVLAIGTGAALLKVKA